MSELPDDYEEKRSGWQDYAESKGLKCKDCTNTILLEDRDTFNREGRCVRCQQKREQD